MIDVDIQTDSAKGYNYGKNRDTDDEEISLIDLFAVLWKKKVMIITITLIAAISVVGFSVVSLVLPPEESPLPNQFAPEAHMLINDRNSSSGAVSSLLSSSSGLGSLAGLMGLSLGGSSFSQLAVYLCSTNTLLDTLTDEFDLIKRYKIEKSPRAESRKKLKNLLIAENDAESGVFTVSFSDIDPVLAQSVVNFTVAYLEKWFDELGVDKNKIQKENLEANIANTYREIQELEKETHELARTVNTGRVGSIPSINLELSRLELELGAQKQVYTQLKVQYELLKIDMASESPVFQILELAEVPDQKSKPSRGLICIIVVFAAVFFAVFIAFLQNAIFNIKKDPEAMAKLRGETA
ncbi:MAG: lipopolysaccharide biosynthesis protein [Treponema sp.]|jgi:uncharacterized protein involved in exopolysaccharide biosynthesis|nr:lipopolysaccharide biosynthesis protein [Treponema sp.]